MRLAYATGVDPVELRLRNDTDTDPYSGRPFSTRAMRKVHHAGGGRALAGTGGRRSRAPCATGPLSDRSGDGSPQSSPTGDGLQRRASH